MQVVYVVVFVLCIPFFVKRAIRHHEKWKKYNEEAMHLRWENAPELSATSHAAEDAEADASYHAFWRDTCTVLACISYFVIPFLL
jgi:hypothetical protein